MGTVFGMHPSQDCVHTKLKMTWIYQWSWVLLAMDWWAFHNDINTPGNSYISGCFKPEMCVQPETDFRMTGVCLTVTGSATQVENEQQCKDFCTAEDGGVYNAYEYVEAAFLVSDGSYCNCVNGPPDGSTLKEYVDANAHPQNEQCIVGVTNNARIYTTDADGNDVLTTVQDAQFDIGASLLGISINYLSLAFFGLLFYVPATTALLTGQILSCYRERKKGNADDEPETPTGLFKYPKMAYNFAVGTAKDTRLSENDKNTCEAFWFSTMCITVTLSQVATVVFALIKYWLLDWQIPGSWFNQTTEIAWLILVILTATRLEYLKTNAKMMRTIGRFGDANDGEDGYLDRFGNRAYEMSNEKARKMIDDHYSEGCCSGFVKCSLKCNLCLSTRCQGDNDPCWLLGCDTPIRHLWFVTIFLDWTQTFNYWYYADDDLNGLDVMTHFAIPSLIFTIWGTSFLLVAQLSRCRALHIKANEQEDENESAQKGFEDNNLVAGVLAISDLFWDEIPNMVLTFIFWTNGGLSGPDANAAGTSIVQATFAIMTCLVHFITAMYNYSNGKYTYIPKFMARSRVANHPRTSMALTMLGGILIGVLGPIIILLHLIAALAGRDTFINLLGDIFKCCLRDERFYNGEVDDDGSDVEMQRKRRNKRVRIHVSGKRTKTQSATKSLSDNEDGVAAMYGGAFPKHDNYVSGSESGSEGSSSDSDSI